MVWDSLIRGVKSYPSLNAGNAGRKAKHKQADAIILRELGYPYRTAPQQVFDDLQWIIALFQVDNLWQPTKALS